MPADRSVSPHRILRFPFVLASGGDAPTLPQAAVLRCQPHPRRAAPMMSAPQDFFGFTTCIAVLAVGLGARAGDQFRMLDGKQIRAARISQTGRTGHCTSGRTARLSVQNRPRPLPASIGEAIVPAASSAAQ
jgi:hypothetical protein